MTPLLAGALVGGILVYLAGNCDRASTIIRWLGIGCMGVAGLLSLLSLLRAALHAF